MKPAQFIKELTGIATIIKHDTEQKRRKLKEKLKMNTFDQELSCNSFYSYNCHALSLINLTKLWNYLVTNYYSLPE